MKITLIHDSIRYEADLSKPLDISVPLGSVKCFYAPDVVLAPFQSGDFIGSVSAGAPVNFYNVEFNPHGNGTHTECVGHIRAQRDSVNEAIKDQQHFIARVVSVAISELPNGDKVVMYDQLSDINLTGYDALVLRTDAELPSDMDYSGTNPPYLTIETMQLVVDKGIRHLLLDLPSVDREQDDGALVNHKCFWQLGGDVRTNATITELIQVPATIEDGLYILNIQTIPINLDASPSRPVLYRLSPMID